MKQAGLSLIESMIGLALVGGVSLILMRQQQTASKMQMKANLNQVINSASVSIQNAVSNRAICSENLKGKKAGDQLLELREYKLNPDFPDKSNREFILNSGNPLFQQKQIFTGGVELTSMNITQEADPVTGLTKDYLRVEFNLDPKAKPEDKKKFLGGHIVARKFLIQGVKDNEGKFKSCFSEPTNLVDSAVKKACLDMGASWNDEASPQCRWSNLPKCVISYDFCGTGFVQKDIWLIRKTPNTRESDGSDRYPDSDYVATLYCCLKDPPAPEVTPPPPPSGGGSGGRYCDEEPSFEEGVDNPGDRDLERPQECIAR